LKRGSYNAGRRPSEHTISERSFLKSNGGAIPPNVLQCTDHEELNNILVEGNTASASSYQRYCKVLGFEPHPARMPISLAKFFINLCTDSGDLVLDPFAGSNTTGAAAEALGRRWVAIEASQEYARAGLGRFPALWTKREKSLAVNGLVG
jgi:DNA modification methylase